MIEIKNITKRYGSTTAVNDISFEVSKGEVLGFLGPNGAGKTTTMRIITCYMPPDSGSVSIAGFDTIDDSLEVRKRIGYLPENAPLYMDLGVLDYLNYVADIRKIDKGDKKKSISRVIEACGLADVLVKDIGELSKGYRQRLGLAQALIHDPDIMILDEPTSGLDPNQIVDIRELIREIGKEKTFILSTHILPEVSATCSRVIIINDGEIVGSGSPDELAAQAGGEDLIYLGIKGPQAAIESKFDSFAEIVEYNRIEGDEDKGGFSKYMIKGRNGEDLCEKFFQLAVDNSWSLNELRKEEASLEDVFHRLTAREETTEETNNND